MQRQTRPPPPFESGRLPFYLLCFPHNPEKPGSRITSVLSSAMW